MKQILNKWFCIFACFALLAAGACSDDKTETGPAELVAPTLTTEGLPSTGYHLLYSTTAPKTFTMSVNAPWEITKDAGWFIVTPSKGKAGEDIVITVTGDYNDEDLRTGSFTIRANSGNNLRPCYTELTVPMKQDAYLQAGIVIEGTEEGTINIAAEVTTAVTFTVESSYDWLMEVSDDSWATISPLEGKGGEVVTVSVTPNDANTTTDTRESELTITATDPEYQDNTIQETVVVKQFRPADKHAVGFEFFSDDLQWVNTNWIETYFKYGWVTANSNEFAVSTGTMKAVIDGLGYTYSASVYCHYEGYIKLGKTDLMGALTLPASATAAIDAGTAATLLLQFDGSLYSSASGAVDSGNANMPVSVSGGATIGNLTDSETGLPVNNVWSWKRYSVLIYNATSDTRITLGSTKGVTHRLFVDNVSLTRTADIGAEAPAPTDVVIPMEVDVADLSESSVYVTPGVVTSKGASLLYSIRINRAWTMETDADWLTITQVWSGTAANGSSIANNVATVKATGLLYNNTKITVAPSQSLQEQTGHIIIKVDGEVVKTIEVKLEAFSDGFLISGITNKVVEVGNDTDAAVAAKKFKVKGSHNWTLTVPSEDTWYTVSPMSGTAMTETEITVTPITSGPDLRRVGKGFTFSLNTGTEQIDQKIGVSQGIAPVMWAFSADEMSTYKDNFKGFLDDMDNYNDVSPKEGGPGHLSFTHDISSGAPANASAYKREIGSTGHPTVTGVWPGDYWLFAVPVTSIAAGTKVHFKGITRTSATGQKFWRIEYNDGGTWKAATALLNKTVNSQSVSYTHAMNSDGATNVTVDVTVTYENAITDGNIEFRFICAANAQASNETALTERNGGTSRWAGAGTATSPLIEIVQ